MNSTKKTTDQVSERQKQIALWTAVIFAVLGLAFLLFWFYNIFVLQNARVDFSDKVLLPVTIWMFVAGIAAYFFIRRNQLVTGLWMVFGVILVPPIAATLVIKNVFVVTIAYLIVFASVSIIFVFPKSSRRPAIIAAAMAFLMIIGIQVWNPAFRIDSTSLASFGPYAIGVGSLALIAFLVWRAVIGNIRSKLATSFMVLAIISVIAVAYPANLSLVSSLTASLGNNLNELASARSVDIGQTIDSELKALKVLALNEVFQDAAAAASQGSPLSEAELNRLDQQWKAADLADNNADPLVASVLNNPIAAKLREFRDKFPQHVELFLTGVQGVSIASTNRTSDYLQSDEEWWQTAYQDGVYIGQPEYDESSKTIAMNMAVAVQQNGKTVGILRTTVNFTALTDTLIAGLFGETGRTNIYLPDGSELKLSVAGDGSYYLVQLAAPPEFKTLAQSPQKYQTITINGIPTVAGISSGTMLEAKGTDAGVINQLNWRVVVLQDQSEARLPLNAPTRYITILAIVIITIGTFVGSYLANVISSPIVRLNAVATKITGGDLTARAKIEGKDETGTLATTFNTMTSRLQETLASLEQRVAERTQSLELAAEVGRSVSQVRTLDVMLKDAVELIRSRFDLYYTQVYLPNPAMTELVLQAGTGLVGAELLGRSHRLPFNSNSINGRAAVEKHSIVISDTTTSATFRPNPLLPETRSEMAVPLLVGEKVVGVLDMQSRNAGALSEEFLPAFEALAGQLAIAIQNASLLAEAEQARTDVETQARRLARTNWQEYLDAIHKPEQTGFVFEQNEVRPAEAASEPPSENAVNEPISVAGEPIGSIVVEMETEKRTARNMELVKTIALQVAQQVENLRLLESTERYRIEAEQAMQRVTREGWKNYLESGIGKLGYMYDQQEVVPVEADHKNGKDAVTLPIKVRDEEIGKLALMEIDRNDRQSIELANEVAERLSAHIESLRQFDQTQSALAQSEKLFEASRELTRTTDLQGLVKATVNSLGISEIDRAILGVLHYDSNNEPDGMTITANWASSTDLPATPVGTYYPKEALKTLSLFMGPEPLFFNDMLNDERVDEKMKDVPRRLNYRAVAALPLFSGSRQNAVLLLEGKEPHNFAPDEMRLFAALAPQIATVMENRRQYEQAQKQAERESALNVISQKIQSATTVEAVLQIAARELGHALGAPLTIAQLGIKDK